MSTKMLCTRRLLSGILLHRNNGMLKKIHRRQFAASPIADHKKDDPSTISQKEVDKFSASVDHWWDPNGPIKALHAMNAIRVPFVRDGLVPCAASERMLMPLKNMKILDVGCGAGILSEGLARIGANVTGIDANEELIQLAIHHSLSNEKLGIKPAYVTSTIEEHCEQFCNYYDGVVASEVIEHVNNKELFVQSCIKALKPGGRIFFTTPTRTPYTRVLGIWVAEYVLNILPKGTHDYDMMVTPTELTFLIERNNCQVEVSYGIIYNVLTNTFQFISSQNLMFALQAVKLA